MERVILDSAWQGRRLLAEGRYWTAVGDGTREDLGEREVSERFGLEALRRRDEQGRGGGGDAEVLAAPLVAREIVTALKDAGWRMREDGPMRFEAEDAGPDGQRWSIHAGAGGERLRVIVVAAGAEPMQRTVRDLGGLERVLRRSLRSPREALEALDALASGPRRWDPIRHAGELDPEQFFALYDEQERAATDPETGATALTAALGRPDAEAGMRIAARLLEEGADAQVVLPDGSGLLHLLLGRSTQVPEGVAELVEKVLDRGADVNLRHPSRGTPLQVLAERLPRAQEDLSAVLEVVFAQDDLDLLSIGARGQSTLGTVRRRRVARPDLARLAEQHLGARGIAMPPEAGIHGGVAAEHGSDTDPAVGSAVGSEAGAGGSAGPVRGSVDVLVSAWQWAELRSDGARWIATGDRWREELDDREVRRRFGSEPFRRRDLLGRSGRRRFDPFSASLVAPTVGEQLTLAGWRVQESTARRFVVGREAERWEVRPDGTALSVTVASVDGPAGTGSPAGPDTATSTTTVTDLGALEDALGLLAAEGTVSARRALGLPAAEPPQNASPDPTAGHPNIADARTAPPPGREDEDTDHRRKSPMDRIVMDSAWQWSRLWWTGEAWHALEGGERVVLDDDGVDRRFGTGAVRRRDALAESGDPASDPDTAPLAAPLIAEPVTDVLRADGWEVEQSTPTLVVLTREQERWRIGALGPLLSVTVIRRGTAPIRGLVDHLGALERVLEQLSEDPSAAYASLAALLVVTKQSPDRAAQQLSAEEFFAHYDEEDMRYISPSTNTNVLFGALGNKDPEARAAIAHRVLDLGMDPTISLTSGVNALHVYFGRRQRPSAEDIPLVRRLLEAGTDPNQQAQTFGTPLQMLASEHSALAEEQLVPLYDVVLARDGLDLLVPGAYSQSALGLARKNGSRSIELVRRMERYLRDRGAEVPVEGGMHGGIHRAEPLSRKDALEIVEGEELGPVIWFEDQKRIADATGIGQDQDGWFSYVTGERAGVESLSRFDDEPSALAHFVWQARLGKQIARRAAERRSHDEAARHASVDTSAPQAQEPRRPSEASPGAPSAPRAIEQSAMRRQIAEHLGSAARGNWEQVRFVARMTAPVSQFDTWVVADGQETKVLTPRPASKLAKELRQQMYSPGTGTWFTMEMLVDRDGTESTTFDHDSEPRFTPEIDPLSYATDQNRFPRDREHTPAWLQEILDRHH